MYKVVSINQLDLDDLLDTGVQPEHDQLICQREIDYSVFKCDLRIFTVDELDNEVVETTSRNETLANYLNYFFNALHIINISGMEHEYSNLIFREKEEGGLIYFNNDINIVINNDSVKIGKDSLPVANLSVQWKQDRSHLFRTKQDYHDIIAAINNKLNSLNWDQLCSNLLGYDEIIKDYDRSIKKESVKHHVFYPVLNNQVLNQGLRQNKDQVHIPLFINDSDNVGDCYTRFVTYKFIEAFPSLERINVVLPDNFLTDINGDYLIKIVQELQCVLSDGFNQSDLSMLKQRVNLQFINKTGKSLDDNVIREKLVGLSKDKGGGPAIDLLRALAEKIAVKKKTVFLNPPPINLMSNDAVRLHFTSAMVDQFFKKYNPDIDQLKKDRQLTAGDRKIKSYEIRIESLSNQLEELSLEVANEKEIHEQGLSSIPELRKRLSSIDLKEIECIKIMDEKKLAAQNCDEERKKYQKILAEKAKIENQIKYLEIMSKISRIKLIKFVLSAYVNILNQDLDRKLQSQLPAQLIKLCTQNMDLVE